ncbi:MAG: pilus assembly protein PilM [Lentisphaeria bacterium]|nr:pilus assembly protein PilM [Lentisphaeria bacterium]
MAKRERFIVLDVGSTALHMGEFETTLAGVLELHAYDVIEYEEVMNEQNRILVLKDAIEKAIATGKYQAKSASICVSGQAAFMRFVKLPPVADSQDGVQQLVEFEAKQNVPFPMDEVVWDYQLIGNEEDEDQLDVMFAVIKNDIVDSIVEAVKEAGLKPTLVDFAPAALYNVARANYIGEDECAMILDIGGKCTTLIFVEGSRLFARSIPIAGAAITLQVAKEFNIPVEEAEALKRRFGFVALGGAYEEPESEVAATISKIVRNVMTRLHSEINRTINIYRASQGGSRPTRLLLSGGSSTMAFTEHFFSEKLRMEVMYFNAFQIMKFSDSINREELSQKAHLLPEVVGVALRNSSNCPVEISLSNKEIQRDGDIVKKVPFIVGSCLVWLMILLFCFLIQKSQVGLLEGRLEKEQKIYTSYSTTMEDIKRAQKDTTRFKKLYKDIKLVLDSRYYWPEFFNALQVAKPLDVWIVGIKAIEGKAKKEEKDNNRTGGFFNFGGGDGVATITKSSGDSVEVFEITGYTVGIPDIKRPTTDISQLEYTRPIFTRGQINDFNSSLFLRQKKDDKLNLNFVENENKIIPETSLPLIFENSLRFSEYFSGNEEETKLIQYDNNPSGLAKNLSAFVIQVRLNKTIPLKRDKVK